MSLVVSTGDTLLHLSLTEMNSVIYWSLRGIVVIDIIADHPTVGTEPDVIGLI